MRDQAAVFENRKNLRRESGEAILGAVVTHDPGGEVDADLVARLGDPHVQRRRPLIRSPSFRDVMIAWLRP